MQAAQSNPTGSSFGAVTIVRAMSEICKSPVHAECEPACFVEAHTAMRGIFDQQSSASVQYGWRNRIQQEARLVW